MTQLDDRYQTGGEPRELPRKLDVVAATLTFWRCATAHVHSCVRRLDRLTLLPFQPNWSMQDASIERRWYRMQPDAKNGLKGRICRRRL